jgi:acetolactate synthase-1/2/3 large subunit
MKTGGQLIVEALEANGADRVFCVPGESYLAVLDALHDSSIRTIVCRQEGGAAMMADCQGRLTGRPGICFVTRGPGATNASAGVHIAMQDSIPMILFIGQIASHAKYREAFQEVDYHAFFGDIAKWVVEIDDAARIPELVTRAFAVATSGRPGPVIVSLPEDMLVSEVEAPAALPFTSVETRPGDAELDELEKLLGEAKRPFVILGGTRWSDEAVARMQRISKNWALPVGVSFRRQMLFDHLHENYAGDVGIGLNPKLANAIKQADLILLVGGRFGEMPSSDYTLMKSPYPDQKLVHVHVDANELGRVYRPTLAINASSAAFVEAFSGRRPKAAPVWTDETKQRHADYLAWSTPPRTGPGAVQMGPIMDYLEGELPEDAIICNGAGNFATWMHRFHRFRRYNTQAAPTSGSMGYGVPASARKACFRSAR